MDYIVILGNGQKIKTDVAEDARAEYMGFSHLYAVQRSKAIKGDNIILIWLEFPGNETVFSENLIGHILKCFA